MLTSQVGRTVRLHAPVGRMKLQIFVMLCGMRLCLCVCVCVDEVMAL